MAPQTPMSDQSETPDQSREPSHLQVAARPGSQTESQTSEPQSRRDSPAPVSQSQGHPSQSDDGLNIESVSQQPTVVSEDEAGIPQEVHRVEGVVQIRAPVVLKQPLVQISCGLSN